MTARVSGPGILQQLGGPPHYPGPAALPSPGLLQPPPARQPLLPASRHSAEPGPAAERHLLIGVCHPAAAEPSPGAVQQGTTAVHGACMLVSLCAAATSHP